MAGELESKVAVVTGGASGIGAGTVRLFVEEGAKVVIADINDDLGNDLAGELGSSVKFVHTDVSNPDQVEALVDATVEAFGGLDIMFNNAGISGDTQHKDFLDEDYAEFDRVMKIDLLGVMYGCRFAGRCMSKKRSGSIINTASTAGYFPGYGALLYRAAKAGVLNFTENAARSLGQHNIRVNAISPGPIATPMMGLGIDLPADELEQLGKDIMSTMVDPQALNRLGQPIDIANAAVFLGSDRSQHITGLNVCVTGGATLGDPVDRLALMQDVFQKALSKGA